MPHNDPANFVAFVRGTVEISLRIFKMTQHNPSDVYKRNLIHTKAQKFA